MIGGNTNLVLQLKTTAENNIGESVEQWEAVQTLCGWLDYQSGDTQRNSFNTKMEQTTHFFICDYTELNSCITNENARAIVNGQVYEVLYIDNPMGMNRQLEIYLKYTGGQK